MKYPPPPPETPAERKARMIALFVMPFLIVTMMYATYMGTMHNPHPRGPARRRGRDRVRRPSSSLTVSRAAPTAGSTCGVVADAAAGREAHPRAGGRRRDRAPRRQAASRRSTRRWPRARPRPASSTKRCGARRSRRAGRSRPSTLAPAARGRRLRHHGAVRRDGHDAGRLRAAERHAHGHAEPAARPQVRADRCRLGRPDELADLADPRPDRRGRGRSLPAVPGRRHPRGRRPWQSPSCCSPRCSARSRCCWACCCGSSSGCPPPAWRCRSTRCPSFFQWLHGVLPLPAAGEAIRSVVYFDGHGLWRSPR